MSTIDVVFSKELEELGAQIEEQVASYSLADAMRSGSKVTEQGRGEWGHTGVACALTSAAIHVRAAQAR